MESAKSLIEEAQKLLSEAALLASSKGASSPALRGPGALVADFADLRKRLDAVDGERVDALLARISAAVTDLNRLREQLEIIERVRRALNDKL